MLLNMLRKKARSTLIYIIFGVIIVVFIFYFGWGGMQEKREGWIVKVNDTAISYNTYLKSYQQLLNFYQQAYEGKLDQETLERLNLKQKALNGLVANFILLETADELDLSIPGTVLTDSIREISAFQQNGTFDLRRYRQTLKQNKLTPRDFEKQQMRELTTANISNLVKDGAKFSQAELWEEFRVENEKVNLEYLEIDPEQTKTDYVVSDQEKNDFYAENKEKFRIPEKIKVDYIEFSQKKFQEKITTTPEETEAYYKSYSGEFWEQKKIHARHILIKADSGKKDMEEEAKKKAEDILAKIKKGSSFEEMAKEHSQDQANARQGGDLGFFSRGQMVKPFEEEAFLLKPGEVSGVVQTTFGFHIIKVEEIKEEGIKPLEDVRAEIEERLAEEKAEELVKKQAYRAYRTLLRSKNFKEYVEKNDLRLAATDYFSRSEVPPMFGDEADLFLLTPGEINYPLFHDNNYYVVRLLEKQESRIPEPTEVEAKITLILEEKHQRITAEKKAEGLLEKIKEGASLQEIAGEEKLKIKQTGLFSRTKGWIPQVGNTARLLTIAFSLSLEAPYAEKVFEANGKSWLIKLYKKEKPEKEEFEDKKKELIKKYAAKKKEKYLDDWLRNARLQAKTTYNNALMPAL